MVEENINKDTNIARRSPLANNAFIETFANKQPLIIKDYTEIANQPHVQSSSGLGGRKMSEKQHLSRQERSKRQRHNAKIKRLSSKQHSTGHVSPRPNRGIHNGNSLNAGIYVAPEHVRLIHHLHKS